ERLPPGPALLPVAPASIRPPRSTTTSPATRSTTGLSPLRASTWPLVTVSPCRRTTMTDGPPDTDCATLLVTSTVPSEQLVLVTVPAFESIVVVPDALQFQVGDAANSVAHSVTSTLTDGGRLTGVQDAQDPLWHPRLLMQAKVAPHPPQLFLSVWKSTQAPPQSV